MAPTWDVPVLFIMVLLPKKLKYFHKYICYELTFFVVEFYGKSTIF